MQSTKDKIIEHLKASTDHALTKREIERLVSYRKDFETVYQEMQDQKIIEEYGFGHRSNPKLVCLTFEYTRSLPSLPPGEKQH